jgi:hypothetical protein
LHGAALLLLLLFSFVPVLLGVVLELNGMLLLLLLVRITAADSSSYLRMVLAQRLYGVTCSSTARAMSSSSSGCYRAQVAGAVFSAGSHVSAHKGSKEAGYTSRTRRQQQQGRKAELLSGVESRCKRRATADAVSCIAG